MVGAAQSVQWISYFALLLSRFKINENQSSTSFESKKRLIASLHGLSVGIASLSVILAPKWSKVNLIATQDQDGNKIVLSESVYMIVDTWAEMCQLVPRTNIVWHHIGIGLGTGAYSVAAFLGYDKGVYFVLMMLLMNLSTPFMHARWYFNRASAPSIPAGCRIAVACGTIVAYFMCRFYLFYHIFKVFGRRERKSALQAFLGVWNPFITDSDSN